ncbi:hypothetical protein MJO28_000343 [Puccinia striiformis f. sp. tritici]|uniref:CipC-like antibiotic response protein n=3 Tax=Puccinia striiformis TaxID=27350 RepID=A0A0L0VYW4_9BASI|nr:hypothetical protein Pst134EA_000891 [Puccinia striiformis f. sp. tritici]KAI9602113.1 hypothetical protein KEM48_000140 [Puccinia striiformis f. sp. tritici PST-130]KNF04205.1 hypothetical protein PSTG_02556 [Puccinia striiformis f. sp. tritici PST-78]POW11619.1 hypothetical protein PSTT_05108 [Puccinia striiformis]KAH9473827.1 hypothetical protein Pst134EA_000891 [Puccinia striiformis f. sp. tritici]KAI7962249.1 hypothetical protein MJO28_000343 [Puccinia striiformis f. sp. tritici]
MGFFDHESEERKQYEDFNDFAPIREHKSKISHELISGAAAYEAAKSWEDHKKRNGEPEDHAKAKEIAAGIAGAFVDRMVETHGLDYIDREKAKREARERVESAIDSNGY